MSILKELVQLHEEATKAPEELMDILKRSEPAIAAKYARALMNQNRLTIHGMPVDDVLEKASQLLHKNMKAEIIETSLEVNGEGSLKDFELRLEMEVSEAQDVYFGVTKNGNMYLGADVWVHDEQFDEEFEKQFKKSNGIAYNEEDDDHHLCYEKAWKEFSRKLNFWGRLYEVNNTLTGLHTEYENAGGFYRGLYKSPMLKGMKLVDIRLD